VSLDVHLEAVRPTEVYWRNITHNLAPMAREAGIYDVLWRPEEVGATKAKQLVMGLALGLSALEADPDHFRQWNPENGWGSYEGLVEFVREYLAACVENPDADVRVCR